MHINGLVFFLGAATLCASGIACLRHTNPYSRAGGDGYLRRDRRRNIARILFIAAGLSLAMALFIQYVASTH